MNVKLVELTKDNWEECAALSVAESQKGFMASNLYSIAEVQFLVNFEALGINDGERMVGFVMAGLDTDDNNYWIYRFMIDKSFQGRGYGRKGLKVVVEWLQSKEGCRLIMVGYNPENVAAEKLYKSAGFEDKGLAPWGEKLSGLLV
ncbi:GNAT family N-acetyltransferase [Neobacillus sp. YIM B06451]|uniref:GNAT family N-acetyltransferase n=1 Tax=Neobacillus sp. YIM B06451 TaxID=3070994 RepID=UPI00293083A3|nr:GNAT family N-acetyltransferase [Neobacillus sp. YIM B06451]